MDFTKNDGTPFELYVSEYVQDFLINFELVPKSDRTFASIDRGQRTDRYATKLYFDTKMVYINEMIQELQLLRDNNKKVMLNNIPERIFGDNIDHTSSLTTLVDSLDKQLSTGLRTGSIELVLLLEDPTYILNSSIPDAIECVQSKWQGYTIWNTHINESYYRNNTFVDREADTFIFEGEYIFTVEENGAMMNFWRDQRGESFTIQDGDFGVFNMFGGNGGTSSHIVVLTNITYTYMSNEYRRTKIELTKVG